MGIFTESESSFNTDNYSKNNIQHFWSEPNHEKTEKTPNKIILSSNPFERENDIDYLEVTHLKLNYQNQVTKITSYSTTP